MAGRAPTTTAAVFAATAALLLTACGGGGEEKSPDDTKGAGEGTKSPAASAAPSDSDADRPDLSVPKDVKLLFDFDQPSTPRHAAALADAENYIRALKHGIARQDPNDPAYRFYSGAQAGQYAKSQIEAWVKGGWTVYRTDTTTTTKSPP